MIKMNEEFENVPYEVLEKEYKKEMHPAHEVMLKGVVAMCCVVIIGFVALYILI